MSNKHGNPVFSLAMSSMASSTEKCQQFRFEHPFTCMVAGMTGSGKTVWVKSLFQQTQKVIHLPSGEDCLALFAMAARVHGTLVTIPNIEFVRGIPSDLENDTFFDLNKRNLMVIDDQIDNAGGDK